MAIRRPVKLERDYGPTRLGLREVEQLYEVISTSAEHHRYLDEVEIEADGYHADTLADLKDVNRGRIDRLSISGGGAMVIRYGGAAKVKVAQSALNPHQTFLALDSVMSAAQVRRVGRLSVEYLLWTLATSVVYGLVLTIVYRATGPDVTDPFTIALVVVSVGVGGMILGILCGRLAPLAPKIIMSPEADNFVRRFQAEILVILTVMTVVLGVLALLW